jgi:hypothetical protein
MYSSVRNAVPILLVLIAACAGIFSIQQPLIRVLLHDDTTVPTCILSAFKSIAVYFLAAFLCLITATVFALPPLLACIFTSKAAKVTWTVIPLSNIGSLVGSLLISCLWRHCFHVTHIDFRQRLAVLALSGMILASFFSMLNFYNQAMIYIFLFMAVCEVLAFGGLCLCFYAQTKYKVRISSNLMPVWFFAILFAVGVYPIALVLDGSLSLQAVATKDPIVLYLVCVLAVIPGCLLLPFMTYLPGKVSFIGAVIIALILSLYVLITCLI